ncbi:hypothetical protein O7621_03550 [Solwaraspora sp. WMMD937]|uniref:hypothetical protein n=1 Tax=Solwaraspora sp. WMMD937 TaxID=3016090 RepID=UPI00249C48F4|nr:hypothetical protein [Solwaraspora sp. WMMD937]WFE22436.1 hypothetical protein O7621_03550 [Solwaraspora sp. WMMD937]
MNLKEWAASQGIAYITARRQYAAGTLPVPTYRLGRRAAADRARRAVEAVTAAGGPA